ncbi:MAG TPA: hypothetical protein VMM80_11780 [Bacteroidota bacterium]|nr:hypothetical protein [Bacteroidota bacterium]
MEKTSARRSGLPLAFRERIVIHQVHPLKLATDWLTGIAAGWLLWNHELVAALLLGFVPSIVVSFYMTMRVDLGRLAETPLGRYVASPRTRPSDGIRFLGLAIAWWGAWVNLVLPIVGGLAVILFGWGKGLLARRPR